MNLSCNGRRGALLAAIAVSGAVLALECNPAEVIVQAAADSGGTPGTHIINIDESAQGRAYPDAPVAAPGDTVRLWMTRPGAPLVLTEDGLVLEVSGGDIISDDAVLVRLGASRARLYTFVMPESGVTVNIKDASIDSVDTFLKSVKVTAQNSPSGKAAYYYNGAPVPAGIEFQVPAGEPLAVAVRSASGTELYARLGTGAQARLSEGSLALGALRPGAALDLTIIARRGGRTLEFPYKLCTWNPGASGEAALALLEIDGVRYTPLASALDIRLGPEATNVEMRLCASSAGASVTLNGLPVPPYAPQDFPLVKSHALPNEARVKIVSQDGLKTASYRLRLWREERRQVFLSALDISPLGDYGFEAAQTEYDLAASALPYQAACVTLRPLLPDASGAEITLNGVRVPAGAPQIVPLQNTGTTANLITVGVSASGGLPRNYRLKLYRASRPESGEAERLLQSLDFEGGSRANFAFDPGVFFYDLKDNPLPPEQTSVLFFAEAQDGAKVSVNGREPADGSVSVPLLNSAPAANTVIVEALSPSGALSVYTIKLYRTASKDASLASLEASVPFSFSPEKTLYDLDGPEELLPSQLQSLTLLQRPSAAGARVSLNGAPLRPGEAAEFLLSGYGESPNEAVIQVEAEDGVTQKEYILRFYRRSSGDSALAGLSVEGGALEIEGFLPSTTEYRLNSPGFPASASVSSLAVSARARSPLASVRINGLPLPPAQRYLWDLGEASTERPTEKRLTVEVEAQDGSRTDYTLVLYRDADRRDNTSLAWIRAFVDGEGGEAARVYPLDYSYGGEAGSSEYILHSSALKGKTITIRAAPADSEARLEIENGVLVFQSESPAEWEEIPLPAPVLLTVRSAGGLSERTYSVGKAMLTPGRQARRTPIAEGGEVFFVDGGREEVHLWRAGEGEEETGELRFFGEVPSECWVLLQSGDEVVENEHMEFSRRKYEVFLNMKESAVMFGALLAKSSGGEGGSGARGRASAITGILQNYASQTGAAVIVRFAR